ncbi:alpha/beta fold hydrolase [Glycomyces algeriensis]|uniref:Esterase n=1 Tax=Glycomyces algeriensis TaxID=256037 RepID=A0A9W6GCK5_9ACTN|nr:alpha/beta hydrolase [Glycomyces algeriensis]MDA1369122.1 alpha/beta hydrolase [Glycomyces algeriensis]MDR7351829.1 pimeloyl-ACP methyl ester carboxylesterase [Glycomyces algeriensis]GLI44556.1 esterase [Glycomyces algeriensis]
MDIILIPGFWLDASSWSEITPALEKAGHRTHPITLPGMESRDADRSGIGLRDHVDAVVAAVDALEAPVVLVGHSGGGAVAHAVADARPDRIARVVYVDSAPLGPGGVINDELPVVDGEIPLPDWNVFEDEDLVDLDDELREAFRAMAIPTPKGVAYDKQELGDERRFDVPITLICCEFGSAMVLAWIEQGVPFVKEIAAVKDISYIDLPTGHWPQLTKPAELADALVSAVGRA